MHIIRQKEWFNNCWLVENYPQKAKNDVYKIEVSHRDKRIKYTTIMKEENRKKFLLSHLTQSVKEYK